MRLQRYRDAKLADLTTFAMAERLCWRPGWGMGTETDLLKNGVLLRTGRVDDHALLTLDYSRNTCLSAYRRL